jgi:hypothetical protein
MEKQLEEGGKSKKSWKESSLLLVKIKATAEELTKQLESMNVYVNDYSFRLGITKEVKSCKHKSAK